MPLPLCVGHEVIGKAVKVGDKVKTVKVGDRVGVGAQIQACLECKICKSDNENYCPKKVGKLSNHKSNQSTSTLANPNSHRHLRSPLRRWHHSTRRLLIPHPCPRILHLPNPRQHSLHRGRPNDVRWPHHLLSPLARQSWTR